jgi:hypothetical protein
MKQAGSKISLGKTLNKMFSTERKRERLSCDKSNTEEKRSSYKN